MPVDIASHPQYGARSAKFQTDKAAATTSGDEAALARADADWATARMEMERDLYARQEQEMGRANRLATIKAANPAVDEALYKDLPDLDQAERIATEFQKISAQQSGQGQSWSPPPGSTGGQTGGGTTDENADITVEELAAREQRNEDTGHFPTVEKMMDKLSPTVMERGALARKENAELQRMSLEPLTSKFRSGRSR